MSLIDIRAMVTLDLGWKHITRHVPCTPSIQNRGSSLCGGIGVSSSMAGKSLVNTYVDLYSGVN